jgi:hypothetical protein
MTKAVSNSDKPGRVDFICRRGDTFYRRLTFKVNGVNEDFTGSTFKMQVKLTAKMIMEFVAGDDEIVVTGNVIELNKSAADMQDVTTGDFEYDLQQTLQDGTVKTRLAGCFKINNDVTE